MVSHRVMDDKSTDDYIETLYELEDRLAQTPCIRDFYIRRQDCLNGLKVLAVHVRLCAPGTDTDLHLLSKDLCDMAVRIQKFDSATSTFLDGDENLVYYYETH